MKYAYPVKKMCQWLTVSPSGFFAWKRREMSATARRRAELTALVVEIFTDSDETYGYRRVHAELGRGGVPAGLELIRAIMRDQGLVPCQPRPWRASLTENDGTAGSIPDLANRDFTADAPGDEKKFAAVTSDHSPPGPARPLVNLPSTVMENALTPLVLAALDAAIAKLAAAAMRPGARSLPATRSGSFLPNRRDTATSGAPSATTIAASR